MVNNTNYITALRDFYLNAFARACKRNMSPDSKETHCTFPFAMAEKLKGKTLFYFYIFGSLFLISIQIFISPKHCLISLYFVGQL